MLADKPWILTSADLPALEAALADADRKRVVAYDIMTERFEVTSILQRALVNDAAVYGEQLKGTPADPAVYMESVHHLMKVVSGAPNIRPAWFFDTDEQGEGLNDIGTHLVDLVQWTLFPDQPIDYRADVKVLSAYRWPTMIPEAEFKRVTASDGFPASLAARVKGGQLEYFCNTYVTYTVKGVHAALNVPWDWEAPAGAGDTHYAVYKGSRAKVEVRQSKADNYRTEVYVVPNAEADRAQVRAAVQARVAALQGQWPGVAVDERHGAIHLSIPETFRVGHEAHFAEVTRNFLGYLRDRASLPAWERPNMLAKYYVTTTGTEMSRKAPVKVAGRKRRKQLQIADCRSRLPVGCRHRRDADVLVRGPVVHEPASGLDDQSLDEHHVGDLSDLLPVGERLEERLVRACQQARGVVAIEQRPAGPIDEPIVGAVVDQKHAVRGQDWRRAGLDHSRVEPARTPGQHRMIQRLGPGDQVGRVGDAGLVARVLGVGHVVHPVPSADSLGEDRTGLRPVHVPAALVGRKNDALAIPSTQIA